MDDLLQQGITAYKAGKRDEARNIFITVVKQSPDSEPAWGWLYQASNNDQERIHCLKQIVRINPNNEKAKQKLDSLTGQDFPFESPQKVAPPIQAQRNTVPPVAETEKPAVSQKAPIQNQQKQEYQFVDNSPINYQTNVNSIASLITGILGWGFGIATVFVSIADSFFELPLILAILSWLISIVTGFIGLKQIKRDGSQKGDGLSKSGIIMSGIGCAPFFLITILVIVQQLSL